MRVRCNDCMSSFDENYIEKNLISGEESCPICGRIGCLMDIEEETESYRKFRNLLTTNISVADPVYFNECEDDDVFPILINSIVKALKTNKKCPHCDAPLYLSDLPQYDYVCIECEENFYECEVK